MKKLSTLSLAILSAIALEGCASSTTVRVTEINTYSHTQNARIHTIGATNMQSIGPVFVKTEERCAVSDVAKAAIAKYKNVSDLVNIRMEETETTKGQNKTYSCKYSALAVNYISISPEDYWAWKDLFSKDTSKTEVVIKPPVPAAPEKAQQSEESTETVEEVSAETSNEAFYTR